MKNTRPLLPQPCCKSFSSLKCMEIIFPGNDTPTSMKVAAWSEFKWPVFSSGFRPIEIGDVEEEGMLVVECLMSMMNTRRRRDIWRVVDYGASAEGELAGNGRRGSVDLDFIALLQIRRNRCVCFDEKRRQRSDEEVPNERERIED